MYCYRRFVLVIAWTIFFGCSLVDFLPAAAPPLWIRYPAIAPNAKRIAFCYQGDIWVMDIDGGQVQRLTSHPSMDRHPVWSPDSKSIAFASNRYGNFDIFVVSSSGGEPKRLTYHSAQDTPWSFSPDGKSVTFSSNIHDTAKSSVPSTFLGELYEVPVVGGRSRQIFTTPAEAVHWRRDGKKLVYHDLKGYEDTFRKHHVSSVARDLWSYDLETQTHRKLTDFRGEDREPIYSSTGNALYFLSERSGSFNIYRIDPANRNETIQITKHGPHPVRSLSIADDDTLCYNYHGQIWIKKANEQPVQIQVTIQSDVLSNGDQTKVITEGATEMQISPSGEDVAFVVRGEVFVADLEFGVTHRVTDTPEQERSVFWGNDDRTLYYASERDGSWNIYMSTIAREEEDRFPFATLIDEKAVLDSEDEEFQPVLSPNGKYMAYLHNRDEIRLLDLASKETKTIVSADANYSYIDGDIHFEFSPDSQWLAFSYCDHHRYVSDIGIANLGEDKTYNVTESGYEDLEPKWSPDGRALLFVSDRYGLRSHGSVGGQMDCVALYLTKENLSWARMTEEELKRWEHLQKKEKEKKKSEGKDRAGDDSEHDEAAAGDEAEIDREEMDESADGDSNEDEDEGDSKLVDPWDEPPIEIDTEGFEQRMRRLTLMSAEIASFSMSNDGEHLILYAKVDDKWDLWLAEPRKQSVRRLIRLEEDEPGDIAFDRNGETLVVRTGDGKLLKLSFAEGTFSEKESIDYSAEMNWFPARERKYMFEHVWRQTQAKFYSPTMHNTDWEKIRAAYEPFLPSITNNLDFAEILSEMLGELNASHTGATCAEPPREGADTTAHLGAIYEWNSAAEGLEIAEVLPTGPLDTPDNKIVPGCIIEKIDGIELKSDTDPWQRLNRKVDKRVRLSIRNPEKEDSFELIVKPISRVEEDELLYRRWLDARRKLVEEKSGGRIGYVHVKDMDSESFRRFYSEVLGKNAEKEALIIDTRFNGGGQLTDDLVSFLSGKEYAKMVPRGKPENRFGNEPQNRWCRPVAVVQSESNYSDAHYFPYAFKTLKLGPLVGTPVAGTATAVWWETLIDSSITFGIPQLGNTNLRGESLENQELQPDHEVFMTPNDMASGTDPQLVKAVEVLLHGL